MRALRIAACLIVFALAACSHAPPTQTIDCAARQAWERGLAGLPVDAACQDDRYRQAALLAHDMNALLAERASLVEQLPTLPSDGVEIGQARRRIRQLEVDIEAIRGVAQVRGLVDSVQTEASLPIQKEQPE